MTHRILTLSTISLLLFGCGGGAASTGSTTTSTSSAPEAAALRGTLPSEGSPGRWAEDPPRTPDSDAGHVRFIFTTHADGSITIDGSWSYGDAAPDHDDWDLALQPGEQDAALDASFSDPSHFCP